MKSSRAPGRPSASQPTPQIVAAQSSGAELVAELPDGLGLPTWEALRSVIQWAQEDPAFRSDLFEPSAMTEWEVQLIEHRTAAELSDYLAVIVGELAKLGEASPEVLAQACMCITNWAVEGDRVVTALAFAEAAALSWSANPRYALTAGILMQAHGRHREAAVWLKHAEAATGRHGDRDAQVLALRSLANLHVSAGRDDDAARFYRRALSVARRHDVHDQLGDVSQELVRVAVNLGNWQEAEEHASAALRWYREGSPRVPALAYDLARSWIARGFFRRAMLVLEPLPACLEEPGERTAALGLLACAAGAAGDADLFSTASTQIWSLIARPDSLPSAGPALVAVARGAMALQRWDVAERVLEQAAELGRTQTSAELEAEAQAALEDVRMRRGIAPALRGEEGRSTDSGRALATELLAHLRARTRAGQRA